MRLLHTPRLRYGIMTAALVAVAIAIAVITFTSVVTAGAHDAAPALPRPAGVTAENGDSLGAVIVSWEAVAGAAGYLVGWVAHADYPNHFRSADIPAGKTAYTVTGLAPGADYWFIVASSDRENGAWQWAEGWARLTVPPPPRTSPCGNGRYAGWAAPRRIRGLPRVHAVRNPFQCRLSD